MIFDREFVKLPARGISKAFSLFCKYLPDTRLDVGKKAYRDLPPAPCSYFLCIKLKMPEGGPVCNVIDEYDTIRLA